MPLRLLAYLVRIWEDWGRRNPAATRLPVVVPLVLHQGPNPWSAPRSMDELYDATPEFVASAGRLLPRLDLALHDLGQRSALGASQLRGPVLAKLALALQRAMAERKPDVLAVLEQLAPLLSELYLQTGGPRDLRELFEYVVSVRRDVDVEVLSLHLARAAGEGVGEVVMSTAQELVEKGELQTLRRILLELLELSFKTVPSSIRKRIEGAPVAELNVWTRRVVLAKRIDDVFAPPSKPSPRRSSRAGKGKPKRR